MGWCEIMIGILIFNWFKKVSEILQDLNQCSKETKAYDYCLLISTDLLWLPVTEQFILILRFYPNSKRLQIQCLLEFNS
jgi:hypothetical protein